MVLKQDINSSPDETRKAQPWARLVKALAVVAAVTALTLSSGALDGPWRTPAVTIESLAPTLARVARPHPTSGLAIVGLVSSGMLSTPAGPKSLEWHEQASVVSANCLYGRVVALYDPQTLDEIARLPVGGQPVESAVSPVTGELWVTLYDQNQVVCLDPVSREEKLRLTVGVTPKETACSPDGRWVYVSNWESGTVSVIDTSRGMVACEIDVGRRPRGICFSPDSGSAFVAVMGGAAVVQIDVQDHHRVTRRIKPGITPRHIVISRTGKYLYVSLNLANVLVKLDTESGEILGEASVGAMPRTIALSPNGHYLFVCNYEDDSVSVVDAGDMQEVFRVPTDHHPIGLAISPDGRRLWVSCYRPSTICIFDVLYGPK